MGRSWLIEGFCEKRPLTKRPLEKHPPSERTRQQAFWLKSVFKEHSSA